MQFKVILPLLLAAGINAAPSLVSRQRDSIPLTIFDGDNCQDGREVTIANIPTDGQCFSFSPIMTADRNSGEIETQNLPQLPPGCTVVGWENENCNSTNFVTFDQVGNGGCRTFGGPGRFIRSAWIRGNCA